MQSPSESQKKSGRRGRPPTRGPRQHQELLDAVARKINTDGAGSVVLSEIGSTVGLSRSSLYYYCTDAADLIHQAYMSSCHQLTEDLTGACQSGGGADEQIETLVRRVLRFEHPPMAALNDLDFLPTHLQTDIRTASGEVADRLMHIVLSGQAAGAVRPLPAPTCASLILNVLSWALVSLPWLERRDDAKARGRYIDTVCDILLNGVAGPGRTYAPCEILYSQLMKRDINAFDRAQTAELKSDQIVAAASRLFNLKGLDGVRLDDVSTEIGASKGAIYHHFRDKGALIERCYDRAFDIYELIMRTGMEMGTDPLERAAFVTHLNAQAQLDPTAPLALQPGLGKLAGPKRAELNRRAQTLERVGGESLRKGILDGSCRTLDTEYAPEIIAGYFLGLSRWSETAATPLGTADTVTDIAMFGLRTRR